MTIFERPVSAFMSSPVKTILPDVSLAAAEQRLHESAHSCLAVVDDDGKLCGVLSRTDILRIGRLRAKMADDPHLLTLPHRSVRTMMTRHVVTVDPTTPLQAAALAMVQNHIHRVFIVQHGRPVGVVAAYDLMRVIVEARLADPILRWMSSPVVTINAAESVGVATDLLRDSQVHGLVVEDQEWPVGVFTQTEALLAATLDVNIRVEDVMSSALLCLPPKLPVFRAAAFARDMRARRILAVSSREFCGILSGLDIARIVACHEVGLSI